MLFKYPTPPPPPPPISKPTKAAHQALWKTVISILVASHLFGPNQKGPSKVWECVMDQAYMIYHYNKDPFCSQKQKLGISAALRSNLMTRVCNLT